MAKRKSKKLTGVLFGKPAKKGVKKAVRAAEDVAPLLLFG